MSVVLHQHQLSTPEDLPLRVDLRLPASGSPQGLVIVCHGFKGFKDWGFFPYACESLAAEGFATACFDFSHNGVGDRPGEFDRLDLFEANTFTQELSDFEQVKNWLRTDSPIDTAAAARCGVLGHSRGAVAAVVGAVEDPSLRAVVTWNGVGYALRYSDRQLERWEQDGRMEFVNSRTGQRMAVGFGLVEDARQNAERFDLAAAARRMEAPHLILHAAEDMAVDLAEAEVLLGGRGEPRCRLEILESTGHTFGAVHPFAGSTPALDRALRRTSEWFRQHLLA